VQLSVTGTGTALPPGNTITTVYYDAAGSVVATVQGAQPVHKFTDPGLNVAVATLVDALGTAVATTATTAGLKATVSFTLMVPELDSLRFDCKGVSKQGGIAGQSMPRTIAAALVLGGTA